MLSVVSGFRSYKKQNPFTESLKSAVSDACVHVARLEKVWEVYPKKPAAKGGLNEIAMIAVFSSREHSQFGLTVIPCPRNCLTFK